MGPFLLAMLIFFGFAFLVQHLLWRKREQRTSQTYWMQGYLSGIHDRYPKPDIDTVDVRVDELHGGRNAQEHPDGGRHA